MKNFTISLICATLLCTTCQACPDHESSPAPLTNQSVIIGTLNLTNAWVKAYTGRPNTAAYITIQNATEAEDKLIKAECTFAQTVELHNHVHENGIAKMRPVEFITISNAGVEMKPGGLHIMLMGVTAAFKDQKTIKIKLTFEKAGEIEVDFPVVKNS